MLLNVWMQHQGGAISRIAPQDTAYWGRGSSHNLGLAGAWKTPSAEAERNVEHVRQAWAQIEPLTRGNYINLANTDDRDSRVHAAYGDNYARLASAQETLRSHQPVSPECQHQAGVSRAPRGRRPATLDTSAS